MIDVSSEKLLSFADAAKSSSGRPSISTLHRCAYVASAASDSKPALWAAGDLRPDRHWSVFTPP